MGLGELENNAHSNTRFRRLHTIFAQKCTLEKFVLTDSVSFRTQLNSVEISELPL